MCCPQHTISVDWQRWAPAQILSRHPLQACITLPCGIIRHQLCTLPRLFQSAASKLQHMHAHAAAARGRRDIGVFVTTQTDVRVPAVHAAQSLAAARGLQRVQWPKMVLGCRGIECLHASRAKLTSSVHATQALPECGERAAARAATARGTGITRRGARAALQQSAFQRAVWRRGRQPREG